MNVKEERRSGGGGDGNIERVFNVQNKKNGQIMGWPVFERGGKYIVREKLS